MTVQVQETVFRYVANGVSTPFAYGCLILSAADLVVTVDGVVVTTGFTISGIGAPTGGTVDFAVAPANLKSVILQRIVKLERTTDYQQHGDWLAAVVNPDFDRLWMAEQQQKEQLGRSLKIPVADAGINTLLPVALSRANNLLGFDALGNPVVVAPAAQSATALQTILATSVGAAMIGYRRGATALTTEKALDVLYYGIANVRSPEYAGGAIGDGVADDSAAFNAAVTTMGAGGKIYVPKGTYKLNSTVNIPAASSATSGLTIEGTGTGTLIQPGAAMTSLFNITGKVVTLKGLTLGNVSAFATNGILCTNSSADASLSLDISLCSIVGFTRGISATGQNYNIYDNFFQNNTTHIAFTNDGRNTAINNNYFLGGNIGIRLTKAAGGQQCEGTRITNNTILVTGGSGSGIQIDAGLEIYIGHNIIDQTGAASPGIFVNVTGTDAVSRLKVVGNWIAGGLNSYSFFASGNNSNLDFIGNTFTCTNGLAVTAGLSLTATNRAKIIGNNFLLSGGGSDIAESSTANIIKLENTSTAGTPIPNVISFTMIGMTAPITMASGVQIGVQLEDAGTVIASHISNPALYLRRLTTDGSIASFWRQNVEVGTISVTAAATAYNTSSDYRLKENVKPMVGALDSIMRLKPVTYTWKVNGSHGEGFIAHELQEVAPDCVTGEKDATREVEFELEDGSKEMRIVPAYQGIDTSFLIGRLTAAIQELKLELDIVKAKQSA